MNITDQPSPNFDLRDGQSVDMLILHYTDTKDAAEALDILCDSSGEKRVSAHYVVAEDGEIFSLVAEEKRAWHAGVSHWRGKSNINARSIGIEIVNPGHRYGLREFPAAQMQAVAGLCRMILSRHEIPSRNVVAHSDIAPARKKDPGELFDWKGLAAEGIGLWPEPGSTKANVVQLAEYGYDLSDKKQAIITFQRHFRPAKLDGVWDEECALLLASLLKLV